MSKQFKTLGQIAFEAYSRGGGGWKWNQLTPTAQESWEVAAAAAVKAACKPEYRKQCQEEEQP